MHATADDQLVVIHDATVNQTINRTGVVSDMTLRALRRLDATYNFIPGRNAISDLPPEGIGDYFLPRPGPRPAR